MSRRGYIVWLWSLLVLLVACTSGSGDRHQQRSPTTHTSDHPDISLWATPRGGGGGTSGTSLENVSGDDFPKPATGGGPSPPSVGDTDGAGWSTRVPGGAPAAGDGQQLLAATPYGSFAAIEVGAQNQLRSFGRQLVAGTPQAVYQLSAGSALVLSTAFGADVDGAGWFEPDTSHLALLQVTAETEATALDSVEVPGRVLHSRLVDDALYVVSWEHTTGTTHLQGYDTASEQLRLVRERTNAEAGVISFSAQRAFVQSYRESTLQVLELGAGELQLGPLLETGERLHDAAFINEHEGYARVFSVDYDEQQRHVATFDLSAPGAPEVGRLDWDFPVGYAHTVRFDGGALHVGSFNRTGGTGRLDSLDLSNPTQPRLRASLDLTARVVRVVSFDDRLLVVLDREVEKERYALALVDVSRSPATVLDEVTLFSMPQGYASIAVFRDQNLVVARSAGASCPLHPNQVQLIEWANDELVLRGGLEVRSNLGSTHMVDDQLVLVTDNQAIGVSLDDWDEPSIGSNVRLVRNVLRSAVTEGALVSFAPDEWTGALEVSIGKVSGEGDTATVEVQDMLAPSGAVCSDGVARAELFASEGRAYATYAGSSEQALAIFDTHKGALLARHGLDVARFRWSAQTSYEKRAWAHAGVVPSGVGTVVDGQTLLFLQDDHAGRSWVEVRGAANAQELSSGSVDLPTATGVSGLHAVGGRLFTSHFEELSGEPGRVRFYLDELDANSPEAPMLRGTNIAGSLIGVDTSSGKLLTLDYQRREAAVGAEECASKSPFAVFDPVEAPGKCRWLAYSVRLSRLEADRAVLEDSWELAGDEYPRELALGDGVLFALLRDEPEGTPELAVLSGFDDGRIEVATVALDARAATAQQNREFLVAKGALALVIGADRRTLHVVDTSTGTPKVASRTTLEATVSHVAFSENQALLSLGYRGVSVMSLP